MAFNLRHLAIRLVLIASSIGLWAIMNPELSYACSCGEIGSPSEALAGADAVFMGRAVSVSYVERVHGEQIYVESVITKFNVTTVWKGPISETTYINTGGPCGTSFDAGEEYIVYAHNAGRRAGLATGLCTRTTLISRAMADLAELGEGTNPLEAAASATPQQSSVPSPQPTDTPVSQPTGAAAPQATDPPMPQPTNRPTPQAANSPAPQPMPSPTAEITETGGGCSPSPNTHDLSVVGLLAGLAWFGFRKRRSESA